MNPIRGTLLNTGTVILGSCLGLGLGAAVPPAVQTATIPVLGLVVICLGVKMFFEVRNILVVVAALSIGVVIGISLGIDRGLLAMADALKSRLGGGGSFRAGFIGASVLFCVGPMTLLGCLQDGLEKRIELLSIKSLLDGVTSFFLAASLGFGVLVSALSVLVLQGGLTLAARALQPLAKQEDVMGDLSAVGGVMLVSIGLGMAGIRSFPTENDLPALLLAPGLSILARRAMPKRNSEVK